jgi:hypothetical protein
MFEFRFRLGGAVMSDMGLEAPDLEAPDADAAEQHQELTPEQDDDESLEAREPPLEADEADAAEQAEAVIPDDDEYR